MAFSKSYQRYFFLLFLLFYTSGVAAQAPANDDCSNAETIVIADAGYGTGTFTSTQISLANATIQAGESFAPAPSAVGLDKKSVWFKFSIPSIRDVRISITQPGSAILAGDVGFAVYQASGCLPTNADISSKLTSIITFGNTYHPCVPTGDYLIQVSAKAVANGPINIVVEINGQTSAAYDHPATAYPFGVTTTTSKKIDFDGSCHSIDDATEICPVLSSGTEYRKTAWFTFTTPAYLDYLIVTLSGTNGFFLNGGLSDYKKFGYRLYRGDAVTTPVNMLTIVDGCDSLLTNGYYCATKQYLCGTLEPATTYTVQLFINKDFTEMLRLGVITGGTAPTVAPLPVGGIGASHALGNLNSSADGISSYMIGYFGCNSRHGVSACGPAIPATGINIGGSNYNLSSFGTFTLPTTADINLRPELPVCGPRPVIRLFKQSVTVNCADLDLANLIGTASTSTTFNCLSPGDYVVQILGRDSAIGVDTINYKTPLGITNLCLFSSLGTRYVATITAYSRKAINKFSLNAAGMFDSINVVAGIQEPLQDDGVYLAAPDTFGCSATVRSKDTSCYSGHEKIMYRQFSIADSGTVSFETLLDYVQSDVRYKLYSGDASAFVTAQNIFNFPDKITGLVPNTECMNGRITCDNKSTCVIPGTYTFTTMGKQADIGTVDQPTFTFKKTRTIHNSPFTAQDMGSIIDTIGAAGGDMMSDLDTWSCDDNAVPVNDYVPCRMLGRPATKAIYRQFYLKEPALIKIASENKGDCINPYGIMTLFAGKATDGLQGLTIISDKWTCFNTETSTEDCKAFDTGWYTVISWATGPSYDSTMRLLFAEARYNSYITHTDQFTITVEPDCKGPQFNRPYKASVQPNGQPHLFEWSPTVNSTSTYPETFRKDTLPTEYFNCTADTPFSNHPIIACLPTQMSKVAYYVFKTTQVSFLQINTKGLWGKVYNGDVRTDSLQFDTLTALQECSILPGYLQFCHLQPGTYTLVLFAGDGARCSNFTPGIFIDSVGYSRFDFAQNAYDFGVVPPDSLYHFGKPGDVNPLDATRPPSSDFFYCTTGAARSDPGNSACNVAINGNIYSTAVNQPLYNAAYPETPGSIARRNLWYTFVAAYPGTIKVKVENKTQGRGLQPQFAVFSSNVDGSLPFNTVQSNGMIDSSSIQGLNFIVKNYRVERFPPPCFAAPDEISFFRPACDATPTRYYIMVDNVYAEDQEPGGQLPNTQIDVSILIDSLDQLLTIADHYYQAQTIVTGSPGVYTGPKDNYSCASRDATDPLNSFPAFCYRTLWYKFTSVITGNVRYRIHVDSTLFADTSSINLYRQTIPGDSTFNGLQLQEPELINIGSDKWQESCISPGTYYFVLPGCGRTTEFVYPEIELIENEGDICSNAIPVLITGAGNTSNTVKVTCHTIGTDYGEFGSTLTCPQEAVTADYKTSWFRMDITGTDTLDVTTSLTENTNAASGDIKYRLMTGNCGAMQEQSCVLDALTQNTFQCLIPGQSYYVQVITPVLKNGLPVIGTISMVVSSVAHTDTCGPVSNCIATANFVSSFDCSVSDNVQYANYSTFGTSIAYTWDFGYNNQTSTAVSPSFFYPALPYDSVYNVRLIVKNIDCGKADTITKAVTVLARPFVNLGNNITQCDNSVPVILGAPSYTGAIYQWQDNSSADSLIVSATGNNDYHVKITYNGCTSSDTISVFISSIAAKTLEKIIVCTGSRTIGSTRGVGETYQWNTGETTDSINVSTTGIYWVDLFYGNCIYRDSFDVVNINNINNLLGNDTTLCFSKNNYVLNATVANADNYTWQNGTNADSILVTAPGQYSVAVSIGSCTINDTVNITDYPAAVIKNTDTSVCNGKTLLLPWGDMVTNAGIYKDTLLSLSGCDSLIAVFNVTLKAKPNLGSDSSINICSGNTIDLNTIYNTGNTNLWSSNTIPLADVSAVNTAGDYQLITINASGCSDTVAVTIAIDINPRVVINDPDTVCANTTVDLTDAAITNSSDAGLIFTFWQDASATIAYNNSSIAPSGTYYIKGTNSNGCFDIKPVLVTNYSLPVVNAGDDFAICNDDSALLNAVVSNSFSPVSFLWEPVNDGGIRNPTTSNSIVKPIGTQQYIITVKDSCNITASDSIVVIMQRPVPAFAGNDTIAVTGVPHQLKASGGINYAWQPSGLLNNATVANPLATIYADSILFTVIITDITGCTGYDTIKVKVYNAITYFVPNAFSPDGNGINDIFKPTPVGIVSTEYFRIFNRYGQLVFETSQTNKGWDGTFKGKPQLPGNYVWMLKGKGRHGKAIEMKGNVLLLR